MRDLLLESRPLGFPWETFDPFLFCVHHLDHYPRANEGFGPAASLSGRDLGQDFAGKDGWRMYHGRRVPGFPPHPHRGFETVTVVRRGLVDHSDSLGAQARYGAGDVQWLTAGQGIMHAEMFPLLEREQDNPVELFQIWLNLPRADKMAPPHFSMFWRKSIPVAYFPGPGPSATRVTMVAGGLPGHGSPPPPPRSWAARADSDLAIWTVELPAGARWTIPPARAGTDRTLYFFSGPALELGGQRLSSPAALRVRAEAPAPLAAPEGACELLLLQGRPIGEPAVQYGPFVMNTRQEIVQAFQDYQRTQFGGWPWPNDEPVHGREGRFARHADGRLEKELG